MRGGRRGSWQKVSTPNYFGFPPKEQAVTKFLNEGEAEVRAGEGGAGAGVGAGETGPAAGAAVEVGVEVGGAGRGVGAEGGGREAGVRILQLPRSRKSFKRIDPTDAGQRNMTPLFQRWAKTFNAVWMKEKRGKGKRNKERKREKEKEDIKRQNREERENGL